MICTCIVRQNPLQYKKETQEFWTKSAGYAMEKIFREVKGQIAFRKNAHLNYPAHVHDDIELVYVQGGGGTAWCDGKKYELRPGTWFLTFPNQVHRYTQAEQGVYYVLILKPAALLRYRGVFMEGVPRAAAHSFPEGDDGLLTLLEMAFREYTRDGFSDVIAAYLTALFGKLLPCFAVEKSPFPRENVQKILQFCAEHYREELTVGSVAENLGISRSCVSHIFSSRIGVNFCEYINGLRLTEAEILLGNGNYTATEVASLTGFSTIRTFNRAFRKKHGIPPSAYRKRLKV